MSFIIALYVREGLVMASDSRLTINQTTTSEDGAHHTHVAVGTTDSVVKTFLTPAGVGISTYGQAAIKGCPISGFIRDFIAEKTGKSDTPEQTAKLVKEHFKELEPQLNTGFLVAGYAKGEKGLEQHLWEAYIATDYLGRLNVPEQQGVCWRGEADVVTRLIQPLFSAGSKEGEYHPLPYYQIEWGFFTLQDAVDFAVYAVESTIELMRFQPRPQTVGGKVDVLAITPDGAEWVHRKELGVSRDFYNPFD
jgi:20S proteasome alpha/beta subunit